ncbi:MAG: hypothetical protein QOD84_1937 [Acidobacteriaceae bacterium]|jgi:hypothetical protein
MPKITGFENIVQELRQQRVQLTTDLRNVDSALGALTGMDGLVTPRRGIIPAKPSMSAAARRKISLAQKERWAKLKAGKE